MESFDARELLARILIHVPEPRQKTIRYYAEYSAPARARRRRDSEPLEHMAEPTGSTATATSAEETGWSAAERRAARRRWASLIRRIYEVNPLTCACGAQMRVISFIFDPTVIQKILTHLKQTDHKPGRSRPVHEAKPA